MDLNEKVFPTRVNLNRLKKINENLKNSFTMLKKKSDSLNIFKRDVDAKIDDTYNSLHNALSDAYYSIALCYLKKENPKMKVCRLGNRNIEITMKTQNISGHCFPVFVLEDTHNKNKKNEMCRGCSEQSVDDAFINVLKNITDYVTLFSTKNNLDKIYYMVKKRVNALEFMLLPKIDSNIRYITTELDEVDREDFVRLKKLQKNKEKNGHTR